MARRLRADMIAETRASLIAAAREAFGSVGYAGASMDEMTAAAGLTRGALYHHFGDKKGLFAAVIDQIDAEMTVRLRAVSARASDRWTGFRDECAAYLAMALEPEIQRIMLRDGPAVLGDPWSWPIQNDCIRMMARSLDALVAEGVLAPLDPEAVATLIFGATQHAAQWIAHAPDPEAALKGATDAFDAMLNGLLR
ncbi:TetR/AcrR family transcriptional regulator [uncultured Bosea sp.]|uniref:TetR/AcrR family transcriptional regulator n=1 Tax=uncultured Bosea sp. TaxID=211457 RepID=UPI00263BE178|nr:TetR/AcrR family transcriptional regulator [uncultured Bosea sp.]